MLSAAVNPRALSCTFVNELTSGAHTLTLPQGTAGLSWQLVRSQGLITKHDLLLMLLAPCKPVTTYKLPSRVSVLRINSVPIAISSLLMQSMLLNPCCALATQEGSSFVNPVLCQFSLVRTGWRSKVVDISKEGTARLGCTKGARQSTRLTIRVSAPTPKGCIARVAISPWHSMRAADCCSKG